MPGIPVQSPVDDRGFSREARPAIRGEISPRIKSSSLRFKCNTLPCLNRWITRERSLRFNYSATPVSCVSILEASDCEGWRWYAFCLVGGRFADSLHERGCFPAVLPFWAAALDCFIHIHPVRRFGTRHLCFATSVSGKGGFCKG